MRKVHLGCGSFTPDDWINVDGTWNVWFSRRPVLRRLLCMLRIIPRSSAEVAYSRNILFGNITRRLPFDDASVDVVYSSHTLEHIHLSEAQALLKEIRRILKPGGIVRMLVPDLRAIVLEYMRQGSLEWNKDEPRPVCAADVMNRRLMFREPDPRRGNVVLRTYRMLFDFLSHKWMYDEDSLRHHMEQAGFVDCRRRGFLDSSIPGLDGVEMRERIEDGQGVCVEGIRPV